MKFYIIIFVILTTPFIINAQTYEIGGFLGAANYIGDVGKTTFIAPKTPVYGGIFKWNRSPRHSFRGSFLFGKIEKRTQKTMFFKQQLETCQNTIFEKPCF